MNISTPQVPGAYPSVRPMDSHECRIEIPEPATGSPTNAESDKSPPSRTKGTQAFLAIQKAVGSLVNHGIAHRGTGSTADLLVHLFRYETKNGPYVPTRPMNIETSDSAAVLDTNADIELHAMFSENYLGVDLGGNLQTGLGDATQSPQGNSNRTDASAVTLDHWLDGALASSEPNGYLRVFDNDEGFGGEVEGNQHVAGLRTALEQLREDTGASNVNMGAITLALSEASGKDAGTGHAALTYLRDIDVVGEIRAAIPEGSSSSSRASQVPQETKDVAWRAVQLLAMTKSGMEALKVIAKKADDPHYAFYEPVLTVFLRRSKDMVDLDPTETKSPTPQSVLADDNNVPGLLLRGLRVAAKRLAYDITKNPPEGNGTAKADDQPDLKDLTWKEKRDYALVRCGNPSDDDGSRVDIANKRTTKAVNEWVEGAMNPSNSSHKSPMSSLTEQGMRFASQGGVGEYKSMNKVLSQVRDALKTLNDSGPAAPPAELRDTIITGYVREAVLEIWSNKMLWEFKDGSPFTPEDVKKMKERLETRVQGVPVDLDRSGPSAMPITMLELAEALKRELKLNLQATPELMATWWNDLKNAADSNADTICKNEDAFHKALAEASGQRSRNAPLPENLQEMAAQEGRRAIAASVKEMWSGFELGSTLKTKDGYAAGVDSKNFLYHAWAIAGGAGVVQFKPKAAGSRAHQGEVTFALFGDGASINLFKRKADTFAAGPGVFVGKRFTVAGQGATAGASVDAAYTRETAHSAGVIYRMDREGLPARGDYKGRKGGLPGDTQLAEEMGEVSEVMLLGLTDEEIAEGMTPMDKVLSTFPDSLSITIVTPEDDSETTKIGTAVVGGGASVNLGPISLGPAVSIIGGRRISEQIRDEKGDGVTVQRKIYGDLKQVSASIGAGAARMQPFTDTEAHGVGSGNAAATWDFYLGGSKSQETLVMVNGKLTSGSHKLVAYTTVADFEAAILSRLDPLSEQTAERAINGAKNALQEKGQELPEQDRRRIVDNAKQYILEKLKYFKEEDTATQSFLLYDEVNPAAVKTLNELLMMSRIAKPTNPELFEKCQAAMDQVVKDPGSWVTMFGLNVDGLEQVKSNGVNAVLNAKKQEGQFASQMKNFLVFK